MQLQRDFLIAACNSLPRINDKQDKVCLSYGTLCLLANGVEQPTHLPCDNTPRINHLESMPKPLSLAIVTVTSNPRSLIHQSCRTTDDTIEQGGFTNIGAANNRHTSW